LGPLKEMNQQASWGPLVQCKFPQSLIECSPQASQVGLEAEEPGHQKVLDLQGEPHRPKNSMGSTQKECLFQP